MRNISFSLTEEAFMNGTKDVTRRLGWTNLKVGERVQGCRKVMGRLNGEPLVKLAVIEVVSIRRERLESITDEDVVREGFPHFTAIDFVAFFCRSHKGCEPDTIVTRIEFKKL